mgnify:CR=1 FL=1
MYKLFFLLILTICCSKDSTQTNSSISLSQEDISNALEVHNKARADVGVEKLEWSNSLSADAQNWADNLAEKEKSDLELLKIIGIVLMSATFMGVMLYGAVGALLL